MLRTILIRQLFRFLCGRHPVCCQNTNKADCGPQQQQQHSSQHGWPTTIPCVVSLLRSAYITFNTTQLHHNTHVFGRSTSRLSSTQSAACRDLLFPVLRISKRAIPRLETRKFDHSQSQCLHLASQLHISIGFENRSC